MIMLLITIVLLAAFWFITSFVAARYAFRFLAHRFYTVEELTPEFQAHFASQLAQCSLPCKRLISSQNSPFFFQGPDIRPIIYAAGEIYINKDICKHFSPEGFLAGLLYEQAHYETGIWTYSQGIMFILFVGCLPFIAFLNMIMQSVVDQAHPWMITSVIAWTVNLMHTWPLLQLVPVFGLMAVLERIFGGTVVNYYAHAGHDLKSLLRYLQYVESYASVGVNQCFNITTNKKRCEKLLQEQESE